MARVSHGDPTITIGRCQPRASCHCSPLSPCLPCSWRRAMLAVKARAPALGAHIGFALGVMPLILAAMSYFVPVLTRGAGAGLAASWLPPLHGPERRRCWCAALATNYSDVVIGLAASAGAGSRARGRPVGDGRVRRMIGRRHPGLDWYFAALAMLLLALCAVLAMPWFPDAARHSSAVSPAREPARFCRPDCLGYPAGAVANVHGCQADPEGGHALACRDLKWAVAGCLIAIALARIAAAASGPDLAVAGCIAYLGAVLRMLFAWAGRFCGALLAPMEPPHPCSRRRSDFVSCCCSEWGTDSAFCPVAAIAGFVVAFLLPLISGATAQLLPIWLRPGGQGPWHANCVSHLGRWSGARGVAAADRDCCWRLA
jgi:hypothetical protein